jgi:hypothetical protein
MGIQQVFHSMSIASRQSEDCGLAILNRDCGVRLPPALFVRRTGGRRSGQRRLESAVRESLGCRVPWFCHWRHRTVWGASVSVECHFCSNAIRQLPPHRQIEGIKVQSVRKLSSNKFPPPLRISTFCILTLLSNQLIHDQHTAFSRLRQSCHAGRTKPWVESEVNRGKA